MLAGEQLDFRPGPVVAERLRALGRTEDVMFSPDQTRLAIAGFRENRVLILGIRIVAEAGVLAIESDACVEIRCPEFKGPHGLAWIDGDTLVVANRGRDVLVVPVPAMGSAGPSVAVEPLLRLAGPGDGIIKAPGSVAVVRLDDRHFDFLVCNNYRNYVSRHIVRRQNGFDVLSASRLFEQGLKVPDSISVSTDGGLVAVSNHYGKRIDVFRNDAGSAPSLPPAFSLGLPGYPHGVRFALQDRLVLVADAGAPCIHVYARGEGGWASARGPSVSVRVMDDEAFRRGQNNPEEGGPKGLDILNDGSLVAVSCEEVPIAFFDFRAVRDQLVDSGLTRGPDPAPGEARLLETTLAALKGQQGQIAALQAEVARLTAERERSLDRRFLRLLRRLVQKAKGSEGKGGY